MKSKMGFLLIVLVTLLLSMMGCKGGELSPTVSIEAATATMAPPPTSTPTAFPIPTPTPTPFLDLGSAMISPADSMDFLMDYGPMDTWVDGMGMHAGLESFYQDGPGVRITLDCAWIPYSETRLSSDYMTEVDPEVVFGRETHIYVRHETAYMYFFQDNCRAEILLQLNYELEGALDEDSRSQLEAMGSLIQKRLLEISSIDEGLSLPLSREVNTTLYEETFYSIEIYKWGEPFRSYSVMLDTKKPFIKEITFGLFETDMQEFIFKRVIPNFPPMGSSLVDNLGITVGHSGDGTMVWEANYELYVWVEDELVGIFPLEKYEQPRQ